MSKSATYYTAFAVLQTAPASQRCAHIIATLKGLGFNVRSAKKAGHYVYVHDDLPGFLSGSFTCGHGKNPEVKPAYVRKMLRVLQTYEAELIEYLERQP
jgi:hypothetical protein